MTSTDLPTLIFIAVLAVSIAPLLVNRPGYFWMPSIVVGFFVNTVFGLVFFADLGGEPQQIALAFLATVGTVFALHLVAVLMTITLIAAVVLVRMHLFE